MAKRADITPEICRQFLRYDDRTGRLFWRDRARDHFATERGYLIFKGAYAGREAGCITNGYIVVRILGVNFFVHRVIFAIKTGRWPVEIDHDDGDGTNNRWPNLIERSHQENMKNRSLRKDNPSGHVGVKWLPKRQRWESFIAVNGKRKMIGRYRSIEAAIEARVAAARLHGFNPNHGRAKRETARKPRPPRRFD